jgi:hypothetical protein
MAVDFAITCSLVRPGRPRYPVLVHRAAVLLHASFRPRLATTPLRFANPSPPSGWVKDFHLQAVDHARHTQKRGDPKAAPLFTISQFQQADCLRRRRGGLPSLRRFAARERMHGAHGKTLILFAGGLAGPIH